MDISPKEFLQTLVSKNLLDQSLMAQYEIESLKKNLPIDQYLLNYTNLPKDSIMQAKAEFMKVPYVDISTTAVDPQALKFVPQSIATKYKVMPYMYDSKDQVIYLASIDPLNVRLQDYIEMKTGLKTVLALSSESEIIKAITVGYTRNLSPEVEQALKEVKTTDPKSEKGNKEIASNLNLNNAPIAKIVNTILEFAMKSRASDIHIEPQETKTRVRYRIDGILQEKLSLPATIHESLISRIKILSEMKIDEKRIPQDGRFNFKNNDEEIDLRVSTLPTIFGEKVVMRLLRKTGGMPTLQELGLDGAQLKRFEDGIARSYGIVLVTGPTGSGKTTTLYSVLNQLNTKSVNIVTLEDPVEYQIPGINQVQINNQAGLTFASGLKSFLRQDPNIILVGEIRDKETTQLAIQAALTGHLVFSTLHTNDAATAVPRLEDMGGEAFLLASILSVSMAQRIVRRICTNCREVYEPAPEIQEDIKRVLGVALPKKFRDGAPIMLAKGKKCEECNNSGYKGRIGIFEILKFTPASNKLILQEASSRDIEEQAIQDGMLLMKQDGYLKALKGLTTIEEVMRVTDAG